MGPTHVLIGLLLAAPAALVAPELAPAAALAGIAGGVFPDLDMLAGVHRRTLHFPVCYWALALPAATLALVSPTAVTVALAAFVLSAAVHCAADLLGGSSEARPWEAATDRGVYLHVGGRWLAPRRWIRYDGAPEDLLLAVACSPPGLFLFGPRIRAATVGLLALGTGYVVGRKRIPQLSGRLPGALAAAGALLWFGLLARLGRR